MMTLRNSRNCTATVIADPHHLLIPRESLNKIQNNICNDEGQKNYKDGKAGHRFLSTPNIHDIMHVESMKKDIKKVLVV